MKELVVISPLNDWTCRECQGSGDPMCSRRMIGLR